MTVFIGFTGLPGAGKGALIDEVKPVCRSQKLTTNHISLSDELREMVAAKGLKVERPTLNKVANELRKQLGNSAMAQVAFRRILASADADVILIDAIRTPEEVDWFRMVLGAEAFKMVSVVADNDVIVERIQKRARGDENIEVVKSSQRALELLESEAGKSQPKFGLNISGAIANSDLVLDNSGDELELERFSRQLLEVIAEMINQSTLVEDYDISCFRFLTSSRDQRLKIAGNYSSEAQTIATSKLRVLLDFETDAEVRWHLIKTIGVAKHTDLSDALVAEGRRTDHKFENTSLHLIAAWSLGQLGAAAMPAVASALGDFKGAEEKLFLMDALGEIGLPDGLEYLLAAFESGDYELRLTTSLSLSKLGEVSIQPLCTLLRKEESSRDRILLIDALIKIGTKASISNAQALAQESEARVIEQLMTKDRVH